MAEVFLRRLTRWQAEQQREAMANLFVACHGAGGGGREAFLDRFERHVQELDFDMATANTATAPAGCLYGFRPERGGAIAEACRDLLPAELVAPAGAGRLFVLTELMVLPEYRRRGVATRLRDLLLSRHADDVVVVAVPHGSASAHEGVRAWSCVKLGEFTTPPREAWLLPRPS